jgi:hypothetical protein
MNASTLQRRRHLWAVAALALLVACGGGGTEPVDHHEEPLHRGTGAASTPLPDHGPNAVAHWSKVAADTYNFFTRPSAPTPQEQRPIWPMDLATVHLAMYDAAMAIARTHRPYAITPSAPADGASIDAAVGAAAHGVLASLFPSRSAIYAPAYQAWLASLPDDDARARGLAVGVEVAAGLVALRADDGRLVQLPPFVPGQQPGDFRGLNPISPWFPLMKPFVIASTSQFRADGPPALHSRRYARDWQETHAWGGTTSLLRTAEQSERARSHTEFPNSYWPRNFLQFLRTQPTVAENARLGAMIWTSMADTLLGCFESKYHFLFWRPPSAITLADTDDNDATVADPAWTPFAAVPNHPEYPAAHACIAGAMREVLRREVGRKVSFAFDSLVTGTSHMYASIDEMADDLREARIWGGMHFRTALEDGTVLGRRTTRHVLKEAFRHAPISEQASGR